MMSSMVKNLPKNPLYSSPSKSIGSSIPSEGLYSFPKISATNSILSKVPIPSPLVPLSNPEIRWVSCKLFTNKFSIVWKDKIDANISKINKKMQENLENYSELGAIFNALSLFEEGSFSNCLEVTGQALDRMNIIFNEFVTNLEVGSIEVIQEYSRLSSSINHVLSYRNIKNIQLEQSVSTLETKKKRLDVLLKASEDYKKLIDAASTSSNAPNTNNSDNRNDTASYKFNNSDSESVEGASAPFPANSDSTNSHTTSVPDNTIYSNSNSNSNSDQLPSDYGGFGFQSQDLEDDPLAQFQMEQSIIWNDGTPSAIPQNNFFSNNHKQPAFNTKTHSDIHAFNKSNHFSTYDLESSVSYPIPNPNKYMGDDDGNDSNDHHLLRKSSDITQNTISKTENGYNNKISSSSLNVAKSEPPTNGASALQKSSFFKTPKAIGGSLLNKISIGFNGFSSHQDGEESRKLEIGKLADEITDLEDLTKTLQDDLILIDDSTQENLDRTSTTTAPCSESTSCSEATSSSESPEPTIS
ncbi:Sorting nexin-41, partial [Smittium mucronatum]